MAKTSVYDATLGEFVEIEVDNTPDPNEVSGKENGKRLERNDALAASDWTTLIDSDLTDDEKAEALVYRQALRDLTDAEGFPEVELPEQPDFL